MGPMSSPRQEAAVTGGPRQEVACDHFTRPACLDPSVEIYVFCHSRLGTKLVHKTDPGNGES